jgi:DnaJ family protein A protein 2
VKKEKILEVDIEKGAPDKKRYVFQNESDEYPGAIAGDAIVEIIIEKHLTLTRAGADLAYEVKLSLFEALKGFEILFQHFDGRKILIKAKEGETVSHGQVKTVKELGMPFYEQPHKLGNLYLRFTIILPERLDHASKDVISKVLDDQKKPEENMENITEKYTLTEYLKGDENSHHSGGKK